MASSDSASPDPHHRHHSPNTAFRALRGPHSPGEFAAAVRRAAREIGEQVSCDARYIGRVESGEIRCPNYAYERVFLHMFPGHSLTDMGFAPRESVRGRSARHRGAYATGTAPSRTSTRYVEPSFDRIRPTVPGGTTGPAGTGALTGPGSHRGPEHLTSTPAPDPAGPADRSGRRIRLDNRFPTTDRPDHFADHPIGYENDEESDVLRRAFMTGGPASLAAASLSGAFPGTAAASTGSPSHAPPVPPHPGDAEARALERAVLQIRLLDDRHGGGSLYRRAGESLRTAYDMLDAGSRRQSVTDRLHSSAGELAISVGWLAHDSGRYHDARSHYAEALATARVAADPALEAHAFCNTAFLARDAGKHREAVRAAQAGQQAAKRLGSRNLQSLLSLREAGGWAGLGDRTACQEALGRAHRLFTPGPCDADPEWMSFFGEAELEGLEAQCWSALREWERAAEHARRAVELQDPHFTRNRALFTAELAGDLAAQGHPEAAAAAGSRALEFLGPVQSPRISAMLETAAGRLRDYRRKPAVAGFLARHAATA